MIDPTSTYEFIDYLSGNIATSTDEFMAAQMRKSREVHSPSAIIPYLATLY